MKHTNVVLADLISQGILATDSNGKIVLGSLNTVNSLSLLGSGNFVIAPAVGKGIGTDYGSGAYLMQSGALTGLYIDGNSTQDQSINFPYSFANHPVVFVTFQNDNYGYITYGVGLNIFNISGSGFSVRLHNLDGFQFSGTLHWLAVPYSLPDYNY